MGQDLKLNVSNPQSGAYSWNSVGGYSAAVVNPVRTGATTAMAGKYYVTVTANGCSSDKDSVTVAVNPAPVINMNPSPKDRSCQGATVTIYRYQQQDCDACIPLASCFGIYRI